MKRFILTLVITACAMTSTLAAYGYPYPQTRNAPLILPAKPGTCVAAQSQQRGFAGAALGGLIGMLASRGNVGYGVAGAAVGGIIGAQSGANAAYKARYHQSQDAAYADWMCRNYDPRRHNEFVSCIHYSTLSPEWKQRIICHFNGLYDQYLHRPYYPNYPY